MFIFNNVHNNCRWLLFYNVYSCQIVLLLHGRSLSGARGGAKPPIMILLETREGGVKPPPQCMETFQYMNTLTFASNHSSCRVYFITLCLAFHELHHTLFSPPMNWNQTPPMCYSYNDPHYGQILNLLLYNIHYCQIVILVYCPLLSDCVRTCV